VASTHTPILFFTSARVSCTDEGLPIPLGTPQSRGKALVNLLPLEEGENVISVYLRLPENEEVWDNSISCSPPPTVPSAGTSSRTSATSAPTA
jgi:DNA gyrase subunit A